MAPRFVQTLRRYRRLLARYLRPEWPRLALLAAVLAATIGVQVAAPLVTSLFIDRALAGAPPRGLIALALLAIGLAIAGEAMTVAETAVAETVGWTATNALRADLLAHLLRLDAPFHTAQTPGALIERVDGDVAALARFFSRFVVMVLGNGLVMVGLIALLVHLDWRIGLGIGGFLALSVAALLRIRTVAIPAWTAERQASADFFGFLGEYLAGLEDVRSSGARAFVLRQCAVVMRTWLAVRLRAGMWGYALAATGLGLFALGTAVAFALSAAFFHAGTLTIGAVYLIYRAVEALRQPSEQLRQEVRELQQADASIGRIETLLATAPRLTDGPGEALPPGPLSVEWDGVSFAYAPGAPVVCDISARIQPGRVLGIVGRTGSGKTTLTRLLPRFYDPDAGTVRLGGVDVRSVRLAAVRARIGLVTQEVHLFSASVRDNVTLFDPGVPDERIVAALETIGLGAWLRALPRGLETPIGPGGAGLSAGEAQLLACARVFLRDPDVVILDEPSARLDPATERRVQTALGRLLKGRTGIIVAHRLATVADADDILILENGRIREYGPRHLLAADPDSRFAALLRLATEEVAR